MFNNKTYRKFFKHLKTTYPLSQKLNIKLVLAPKVEHPTKSLYGLVRFNDREATISVATSHSPLVTLKVLAHEYRHLIQRFNFGWVSNDPSDPKHEEDAQLFGGKESWNWVKAEGLV